MKILKNMMVVSLTAWLASCSSSTLSGQFTAVSSFNVRNLEFAETADTKTRTRGESCTSSIFGMTIASIDIQLQRAVEMAIQVGQSKGIDGNILTNVRVYNQSSFYFFYSSECVVVEGDLVKIQP